MNSNLKTTLRTYCFDITNQDEKTAWHELRAKLQQGPHCFGPVLSDCYFPFLELDGLTIELETTHLFENQWNSGPIPSASKAEWATNGVRVFDWALEAVYSGHMERKHIKRGHYLEQTAEMRSLRDNINACGYCGKQEPAAKGYVFCPHCLDSEYLKASDLHLTRMRPVSEDKFSTPRAELTDAERAHLLPLYRDAQIHGSTERGRARMAKRRADVETKFKRTTANAKTEHDGYLWLLDRGINADPIFYDHTGRFGFGWRSPCDDETVSALLEVISEFPFPYDIKCADGRTLSGG